MRDGSKNNSSAQAELSRRKILKALTALGGAVAATGFMPAKWSSPLVDLGVMPAHAQTTTGALELTGEFNIVSNSNGDTEAFSKVIVSNGAVAGYIAEGTYRDTLMSLTQANTRVYDYSVINASLYNSPSIAYISPEKSKTGNLGIQFFIDISNSVSSFEFCSRIKSNGRTSNRTCGFRNER